MRNLSLDLRQHGSFWALSVACFFVDHVLQRLLWEPAMYIGNKKFQGLHLKFLCALAVCVAKRSE